MLDRHGRGWDMGGKEKWGMGEEKWGKYQPTWTARDRVPY